MRDHAERPGTSIVASQDLVEHGPHPLACRLERLTAWRRPPRGAATPRGIAHRVVHLQLCVRAAFPLPLAELHETAVGLHRDIVTAQRHGDRLSRLTRAQQRRGHDARRPVLR